MEKSNGTTDDVGQLFKIAIVKKYEADVAEAKAHIQLYTDRLVGIGEHSDLLVELDKWYEKLASASDKLSHAVQPLSQKLHS
jgi:hypothetical protein